MGGEYHQNRKLFIEQLFYTIKADPNLQYK
jgi:hypothetical protein